MVNWENVELGLYCKDDVHLSVAGNWQFPKKIKLSIEGLTKVKYVPSTLPEAAEYLVFAARTYATTDFRGTDHHFFYRAAKDLIEESSSLLRFASRFPEHGRPSKFSEYSRSPSSIPHNAAEVVARCRYALRFLEMCGYRSVDVHQFKAFKLEWYEQIKNVCEHAGFEGFTKGMKMEYNEVDSEINLLIMFNTFQFIC